MFAALVCAWVVIVVIPWQSELSQLNARFNELTLKESARISQVDVQILRAKVDSLDLKLTKKRTRLFPGEKLLDLGRTIEKLGNANGLKLISITPDYDSLHLIQQKNKISNLPVSIVFEGRFHQIGQFLDRCNKFPFVFRVNQITMDKPEPKINKLTIMLNGIMVIGNSRES